MFSTSRRSVGAVLLIAGSALLLEADPAQAQNGPCQGRQTVPNGQLNQSQLQTQRQQRIGLITQLRTLQQTGQLTQPQLQTLLTQLRTGQLTQSQLQTLIQQVRN